MKPLLFSLTLCAGLAAASASVAVEVEVRIDNGVLSFSGGQGLSNAVLKVTGPDDFEREETAIRGLPNFRAKNSGRLADGMYRYSLTAATSEKVKIKNPIDNGRGAAARDHVFKPFAMEGSFLVVEGTIKPAEGPAADGADRDAE